MPNSLTRLGPQEGSADDGKRLHGAGRLEVKTRDEIEETRRGVRGEDRFGVELDNRADGFPKMAIPLQRSSLFGSLFGPPKTTPKQTPKQTLNQTILGRF